MRLTTRSQKPHASRFEFNAEVGRHYSRERDGCQARGCGDLQERPAPACLIRPLLESVILKPGAVQPGEGSPIDRHMYAREMTDRKEFKLSHYPTVGRIGNSSLRFCLGFCLATLG